MSDSNKDKKPNLSKFKFNSYWIYGAVLVAIIAVQFFSSGDLASKSISKNKFEEILRDNDIKKIVVVNKDVAQLFLTEEALNKATHKKFTSSTFYRPGAAVYEYNFGDQRTFEESIA
jgi:cell division protease FtsH